MPTLADMREGHQLGLSIDISDKKLLQFLSKYDGMDCVLERKDDGGHYAVVTLQVMRFKHMLDHGPSALSSMAFVVPINRTVEHVVTYLLDRKKCDPRFLDLVKKA